MFKKNIKNWLMLGKKILDIFNMLLERDEKNNNMNVDDITNQAHDKKCFIATVISIKNGNKLHIDIQCI